jgi:heme exporter protein C
MRRIILFGAFILLIFSMWAALYPGQVTPVQRNIIYVHVPSSICALLCFVVLLVASIGYLITDKPKWDHLAEASAEVGAVFATVLNLTGMIFSRAEWGPWWTPSLRLITSAILWFLYVVYLILRNSISNSQRLRARVCAVFGIIAFIDVPMVYISARFLPDIHRPNLSFDSPWQRVAFISGIFATMLLAATLIWIKTDILKNKAKLEQESIF